MLVPQEYHKRIMNVFEIGLPPSEMETDIFLDGFLEAEQVHVFIIPNSYGMVTVPFILLLSVVFLDGAMLSRSLNAQIMPASAIVAHLNVWCRTTHHTKGAEI